MPLSAWLTLTLKTELDEKQKRYVKVIDSSSKALLGR